MGYLPTKFEVQVTFTSWDVQCSRDMAFLRFSHVDHCCRPQVTFDLHEKQQRWSTNYGLPIYYVWSSSNVYFFTYCVYKVFRLLLLLTPNDLWPPWKFNRDHLTHHGCTFTYLFWSSSNFYINVQVLEIWHFWDFHKLTFADLKRPLTATRTVWFFDSKWGSHMLNMRSAVVT